MGCIHGAREVRKAIFDDSRIDALKPIVVWIPMLDSDELPSAERMSAMYADSGVPQFWDGGQLLGKEVTRSLALDPTHVAWDIYLFYPPDAEWTDAGLPPPAKAVAQTRGLIVGAKGTLPPKGDQSMLPPWYEGRADVVGKPVELGALLTAIAVPFVGGAAP